MPIQKEWLDLTQDQIDTVPEAPGIYELGDTEGNVLYIGFTDKAEELRGVLRYHGQENSGDVHKFRFLLAAFLQHPELLFQKHEETFEAENGSPPQLQQSLSKGYIASS